MAKRTRFADLRYTDVNMRVRTSFDEAFRRDLMALSATRTWDPKMKEWVIELGERQLVLGIVKKHFNTEAIIERNKPPEERSRRPRRQTAGRAAYTGVGADPDYAVLHLLPSAPPQVVKAAYSALAKMYHPDKNTDPKAVERMKAINKAYQGIQEKQARLGS
jgi:hypothetical protein